MLVIYDSNENFKYCLEAIFGGIEIKYFFTIGLESYRHEREHFQKKNLFD